MQNAKYGLVETLDIVPRFSPGFFLDRSLYLAEFSSSQLKTCWAMMHCKNSKARLPPKHGSDAVAIESVWY
jgi:hypothetical protein